MSQTLTVTRYVLALSIFCLAGALVYFTFEVAKIRQQIPDILVSVERTSESIEPVVTEVAKIGDLIPPILDQVEKTRAVIPPILKEVEAIRKVIPPILEEVRQTREQIPPILKEVEQTRAIIPEVLREVEQTRAQIPPILEEVEATRELVPDILVQVEKTREAIPPMLDQAQALVVDAKQAGRKASEGAVTGVFTGILTAPFAIVGGIGKSIAGLSKSETKEFTEKGLQLMNEAGKTLLASGEVGESRSWSNPDNGASGTITIQKAEILKGRDCRILHITARAKGKSHIDKNVTVCLTSDGAWEPVDEGSK